jgi:hypothetical protein
VPAGLWRLLLVSAAGFLPASSVRAQAPVASTAVTAMKQFDLLVGEWRGSGWSTAGTGQRVEFDLVETVAPKVGGAVLLIEGHGRARGGNGERVVTHEGLSLLYYDEPAARYRWNGHELSAGATDSEVKPVPGGLEWSLHARGSTVRFTIRFDESKWHEVGEVSADGAAWSRFMETSLTRVIRKALER